MNPGRFGNNPFFNNPTVTSPANLLRPGFEGTVSTLSTTPEPTPTPWSFGIQDIPWITPFTVGAVCLIGAGAYACYKYRKIRQQAKMTISQGPSRTSNRSRNASSKDPGDEIREDDGDSELGTSRDDQRRPPTSESSKDESTDNVQVHQEDEDGRPSEEIEPETNEND